MHAFRPFFGGESPRRSWEERGFAPYISFVRSTPRLYPPLGEPTFWTSAGGGYRYIWALPGPKKSTSTASRCPGTSGPQEVDMYKSPPRIVGVAARIRRDLRRDPGLGSADPSCFMRVREEGQESQRAPRARREGAGGESYREGRIQFLRSTFDLVHHSSNTTLANAAAPQGCRQIIRHVPLLIVPPPIRPHPSFR